jgi:hypothetical protein
MVVAINLSLVDPAGCYRAGTCRILVLLVGSACSGSPMGKPAAWLGEERVVIRLAVGSVDTARREGGMSRSGQELVDRFGKLMSDGDVDGLLELYASDAKVVLFYRVASGREEIRQLLASRIAAHGRYDVISVDQFQDAGDLVMWDATVETEAGPLQTTHVVILNATGLIQHHVPNVRSYWGM